MQKYISLYRFNLTNNINIILIHESLKKRKRKKRIGLKWLEFF